jgi:hypothetical protein
MLASVLARLRHRLRPEEVLLCLYALLLLVLMAVLHQWRVGTVFHRHFLQAFLLLALFVFVREYARARGAHARRAAVGRALGPALGVVRDFFPFLLALIFYERLHDLTPELRPHVVDAQLIAIDHAVFGVDVPVWMGRFATPALTQILVVCYLSYFFAPAIWPASSIGAAIGSCFAIAW